MIYSISNALGRENTTCERAILFCIALLSVTSLFGSSQNFISFFVMPKWYYSVYPLAGLIILFSVFRLCYKSHSFDSWTTFIKNTSGIILLSCFGLAVYGLFGYWGWLADMGILHRNAGFDNPAGLAACLCAGFPLSLYFLRRDKKWIKVVAIGIGLVIITALYFTKSRTGIFSLCLVGIVWFLQRSKVKINTTWITICGISVLPLLGIFYLLNTQSADGRILIWLCTLIMIADKPFFGYGWAGFRKEYMNYQAGFFKNHPQSSFASLAGNTHQVFNEYLHLIVNFGIIGFIGILILIYLLVKWYKKHRNSESDIAFLVLIAIGSFALFSYPFRYPFIGGMVILAVLIILRGVKLKVSHLGMYVVYACVILLTLFGTYYFTKQIKAKILWHKTTTLDLQNDQVEIYQNYQTLWPKLKNNYLFLYNVSATLNRMKDYKKSLDIAKVAEQKCADYDLQLIIADDYFETNKYKEALKHYTIAADMCPVRFFPLYRSFRIYKITGKMIKAGSLAQKIADKPVKVKSFIINRMKEEVAVYLKKE